MDFKPLVTLLAIVNPLAIVPFFIHYTQGFSKPQRRRTVIVASFSAFVVIAISALLGLQILQFFGISLASFQVGGGLLLLISAMNMLNAQPAEAKPQTNEFEDGAQKAAMGASIAVVPLTIPLLTGPATMSTVVIYAEKAKTFFQLSTLVGYGLVIGLATAVCFSLAEPISRVLGKTGINVMTRLMGLILAALAVEVMADGLGKLFPILRHSGGAVFIPAGGNLSGKKGCCARPACAGCYGLQSKKHRKTASSSTGGAGQVQGEQAFEDFFIAHVG